jgi:hypothetical protein
MLNQAIFRKHSKLFLYMISRTYFSQKEIILWSLNNNEFKDKDSWENKGQFRDKMINLGVLKKYSYKIFKEYYPDKITKASIAYIKSHERKRVILELNSLKLIELLIPSFINRFDPKILKLIPIQEYANICLNKTISHTIQEYIHAFIFGCATQKIITLNHPKITKLCRIFSEYIMPRYDEEMLSLDDEITVSRNLFEKNIRKYIESK